MKKLLFLITVIACAYPATSQKINAAKVPQAVKDGFNKSHPCVDGAWEREDANYEANFKESGKVMSCTLNKQGTILETER